MSQTLKTKPLRIAVVGATGAVGKEMLDLLGHANIELEDVIPLASERSAGEPVDTPCGSRIVKLLDGFDFAGTNAALFSAGGAVSGKYAPLAAAAGCLVIDNSAHWRMNEAVPLIVPEANKHAITAKPPIGIIANPNCSTIQLAVAIAPLAKCAPLKRIVADTYQSASGAGASAMKELFDQTRGLYADREVEPNKFPRRLAFNVVPQVDVFQANGDTKEEWKMKVEMRKILELPELAFQATAVRVPVMVGHAIAVHIEFHEACPREVAVEALKSAPGVVFSDAAEDYDTPFDAAGENGVFVSRLRTDESVAYGLSLWCVADNLRKGAALNAVQILEGLRL